MKQLALIDSLIPDVAIFKESLNDDTDFVIFDYYNDSLDDLCNNIETCVYEKIGIVQEDNGSGRVFHQFDNNTLVEFLKSRHQCKSLDLFMCNGYLSWKQEIDQLAETMGIQIGAANTLIGQGCWTLHNGVDVSERYMRGDHMYPHIFMNKKPISIASIVIDDKVYDGTNSVTISSYTLDGITRRHDVVLNARCDDIKVGNNKSLTFELSGKNSDIYCLSKIDSSITANIIPKPLTISGITANEKEYDTTNVVSLSGTAKLVGVIDGDDVFPEYISSNFVSLEPGTNDVNVVYKLTGADVSNYTLTKPLLQSKIIPKTLTLINNTISIQDKIYDGDDKAVGSGSADISGIYNSDVCILSGKYSFASKNVGKQNIIIGLSGIHSHRYKLPTDIVTATILPKEIKIKEYRGSKNVVKYYDGSCDISLNQLETIGILRKDSNIVSVRAIVENASICKNTSVMYKLNDPTENYYLTPTNHNINAKILPIDIYYDALSVVVESKIYDRNNYINVNTPVFRNKSNSIVSLIDCSFVGILDNINVGNQVVNVSLSGPGAINYNLIALNDRKIYANITPFEITFDSKRIRVYEKTYDGKNNAKVEASNLQNVFEKDVVGISGSGSIFESVDVGTWNIQPNFSLIGVSSKNYKLKVPELPLFTSKINPATLTIGGDIIVLEKTYDGTKTATITGAKLIGLVKGDNLELNVSGTYEDESIGSNKKVNVTFEVTGSKLDNYNFIKPTNTIYMGNIISELSKPTDVVATAGVESASISFNPPINGNVNYYIVKASAPDIDDMYVSGYSSPIMVANLQNEVSYNFTVRAYDKDNISSKESDKSNTITTLTDILNYAASAGRTFTVSSLKKNVISLSIPSIYSARRVAYIGNNAFKNCDTIQNIILSGDILSIGANAFSGCNSLINILFNGDRPNMDVNAFENNTTECIGYYYPDKNGWPGESISGIRFTSLLEIIGIKSDGFTLMAGQYLSSIGATDLSYQWYSNTSNSNVDGSIISGETSNTYVYKSAHEYVYVVVNYTLNGSSISLASNAF